VPPLSHVLLKKDPEEILVGFDSRASRPKKTPAPPPKPADSRNRKIKVISFSKAPTPLPLPPVVPPSPVEAPLVPRVTQETKPPPKPQVALEVISEAGPLGAPFGMLVTWFGTSQVDMRKLLDDLVEQGTLERHEEADAKQVRYRLKNQDSR
jgi:hypothetical protein